MLDSGGMSESEDKPPTLASLRARRGKLRAGKRPSPPWPDADSLGQSGLFSDVSEIAPVLDRRQPEASIAREGSPFSSNMALRKPTLSLSVPIERRIWSVRALVTDIRQHVETDYTDLWIEGEISNCRPAPSGHIYFTLKDGEAQLPVVLFRRQASLS